MRVVFDAGPLRAGVDGLAQRFADAGVVTLAPWLTGEHLVAVLLHEAAHLLLHWSLLADQTQQPGPGERWLERAPDDVLPALEAEADLLRDYWLDATKQHARHPRRRLSALASMPIDSRLRSLDR